MQNMQYEYELNCIHSSIINRQYCATSLSGSECCVMNDFHFRRFIDADAVIRHISTGISMAKRTWWHKTIKERVACYYISPLKRCVILKKDFSELQFLFWPIGECVSDSISNTWIFYAQSGTTKEESSDQEWRIIRWWRLSFQCIMK